MPFHTSTQISYCDFFDGNPNILRSNGSSVVPHSTTGLRSLVFTSYKHQSLLPDFTGVYMLVGRKLYTMEERKVLYIGKALNVSERVTRFHEKISSAVQLGFDEVLFGACTKIDLDVYEKAYITAYQPELNKNLTSDIVKALMGL